MLTEIETEIDLLEEFARAFPTAVTEKVKDKVGFRAHDVPFFLVFSKEFGRLGLWTEVAIDTDFGDRRVGRICCLTSARTYEKAGIIVTKGPGVSPLLIGRNVDAAGLDPLAIWTLARDIAAHVPATTAELRAALGEAAIAKSDAVT